MRSGALSHRVGADRPIALKGNRARKRATRLGSADLIDAILLSIASMAKLIEHPLSKRDVVDSNPTGGS